MGAFVSERHTTGGMKKSSLDLYCKRGFPDPFRTSPQGKNVLPGLFAFANIMRPDVCELCCFDVVQSKGHNVAWPLRNLCISEVLWK
jgi:hypothetical protein